MEYCIARQYPLGDLSCHKLMGVCSKVKIIKLALNLAATSIFLYLSYLGLILLVFSPSEFTYSREVPQEFGGALLVEMTVVDHYEFCNYTLAIEYITYGSGVKVDVGAVTNTISDVSLCDDIQVAEQLKVSQSLSGYSLIVNDGENEPVEFTSSRLSEWVRSNQ